MALALLQRADPPPNLTNAGQRTTCIRMRGGSSIRLMLGRVRAERFSFPHAECIASEACQREIRLSSYADETTGPDWDRSAHEESARLSCFH